MGQEIVTRAVLPAPTPQIAKSLSPQELVDHRAKIAFEVKTVLSAYFQPHEAEEIKAAQLAWWCDELQDWTQEQVLWALRQWNRDSPRLRPTPGDIVAVCKKARGRKIAAQLPKPEPEPERKPIEKDARERILSEVGFQVSRFPVAPKSKPEGERVLQTREEIQDFVDFNFPDQSEEQRRMAVDLMVKDQDL